MEEWQRSIDGFASTYPSWLPQLNDVHGINTFVDNSFWWTGGPRGIQDVIRRRFGKRADGRSITTNFQPFLNSNDIALYRWNESLDNYQAHIGNTIANSKEMLQ